MIRTIVAHTTEIDDTESAVAAILSQLDIENRLLKNSVGIISCHYDFLYSGTAGAISAALPFEVLGTVTLSQVVEEVSGEFMLTIMVLTSDDVSFSTALSGSLLSDPAKEIIAAYNCAAEGHAKSPALILPFAPFIIAKPGDDYVHALTEVSGGVPCFGTIAIDDTDDMANAYSIYGDKHYNDRMAILLVYGDINPRFSIATISPEKIFSKPVVVTCSERNILKEVNGHPVSEYFADLGLTEASGKQFAMVSLPFMMDYGDNTPPVSKVFVGQTPEKYSICAGLVPEGVTIRLGIFDMDDVLLTTGNALDKVATDIDGASCVLIYSCVSRSMSLGLHSSAEFELIQEKLGGKLPFMAAYSGGEISPTEVSSSHAINRFHNNAFVICVI